MTAKPVTAPETAKFTTGSTMRHVVEMTLTGMAGLMFMFLVDIAALFWVSQLNEEMLIAALGFAWTIQFAVVSAAIGLMIAATALVSRTVGQRNMAEARKQATASLVITAVVISITACLVVVFRREILAATGAEGETLEIAARFLLIATPSMPLVALAMVSSAILRAIGDAWRAMSVTLSAGVVAMILDPIMILWAGLGTDGAAYVIATSRAISACLGLYFVIRVQNLVAPVSTAHIRLFLPVFAAIAIPAVITQLSSPFGNYVVILLIAEYGDSAVAGWSVVFRILVFAFGGIFALSSAIGGIFGQNYGDGQPHRIMSAYRDSMVFCTIYVLAIWLILAALTPTIIDMFQITGAGAEVAASFFRLGAGSFLFVGALFVANAALNALDRPLWSTGFNWLRDGVLTFPLALWLGGYMAGPGVVYGQALAGIFAGTLAFWWGWTYIKGMQEPDT